MRLKRPKTNFEQEANSNINPTERRLASCKATPVTKPLYNMRTEHPLSMDLVRKLVKTESWAACSYIRL